MIANRLINIINAFKNKFHRQKFETALTIFWILLFVENDLQRIRKKTIKFNDVEKEKRFSHKRHDEKLQKFLKIVWKKENKWMHNRKCLSKNEKKKQFFKSRIIQRLIFVLFTTYFLLWKTHELEVTMLRSKEQTFCDVLVLKTSIYLVNSRLAYSQIFDHHNSSSFHHSSEFFITNDSINDLFSAQSVNSFDIKRRDNLIVISSLRTSLILTRSLHVTCSEFVQSISQNLSFFHFSFFFQHISSTHSYHITSRWTFSHLMKIIFWWFHDFF
jgi:hypothetical protein